MTKKFPVLILLLFAVKVFAAPDGEQLYHANCAVCHGDQGEGGGIGLPLNADKLSDFSHEYVAKSIRLGRPDRIMPAFSNLSDSQIRAIVDYVFTWSDQPVKHADTTKIQGNADHGQELYANKCTICHGVEGKTEGLGTGVTQSRERKFNIIPPELRNVGFLQSVDDGTLKRLIARKKHDPAMQAFYFNFNDQELNDLVSYIRSFEELSKQAGKPENPAASYIISSPYGFEETVENIKASLSASNFRVFPDRYLEMGLTPEEQVNKKQVIIRFCNFNQLYRMLNVDPRLGVLLPCKITVVEQDDGTVDLIVMNMELVSKIFNNRQLTEDSVIMMQTVLSVVEEATL